MREPRTPHDLFLLAMRHAIRLGGLLRRLAIAPDNSLAVIRGFFLEMNFKRVTHEIVPAARRPTALALGAADNQPLGRARHRDV